MRFNFRRQRNDSRLCAEEVARVIFGDSGGGEAAKSVKRERAIKDKR